MAKHAAPRPQYRWWIPATVVVVAAALIAHDPRHRPQRRGRVDARGRWCRS